MTDRPKRPAYQWYPGDFRRDLAVQACSFEARALWREMLDLMHDGEPYGHLTAGGVPLDTAQLARLIGIPARKATAWLRELEDRKVFSRTAAGAIYSRRMVRDEAIIEQRRIAGHEGGLAKAKQTPSKPVANGKQRGKQKTPPASALAVAVALDQKIKSGSEAFPTALCETLYDAWVSNIGATEYPHFRKTLAPLFPKTAPLYTESELAAAIVCFSQIREGQPEDKQQFYTPQKFAGGAKEYVRLGKMPNQDEETGIFTERGRLAMGSFAS